jgi:hypothetical protein
MMPRMLLAQAMMEYGVMDAVAGGVARMGYYAQSAFADPAGRTIIIIVAVVLGYWFLRRN